MLKRLANPLETLRNLISRGRSVSIESGSTTPTASGVTTESVATPGALNPYVEARREWNERYGDYIDQAHHWRTVAFFCSAVALIAVSGVAYIGAQNKVVPYVVEVDKLGEATAVARADHPAAVDRRVIKAYLARFVADWRAVTVDRQAQKGAIDRVYAMLPSGSIGLKKVNDYFKGHNPFALAANESVGVAVTNLLPISDETWQVEWQEVTRDPRGEIQSSVRMKASIIVGIKPPTDEKLMLINPLGVYVRDLNWSQQL
jgi:type IV secretory pathway TrbF-like protein